MRGLGITMTVSKAVLVAILYITYTNCFNHKRLDDVDIGYPSKQLQKGKPYSRLTSPFYLKGSRISEFPSLSHSKENRTEQSLYVKQINDINPPSNIQPDTENVEVHNIDNVNDKHNEKVSQNLIPNKILSEKDKEILAISRPNQATTVINKQCGTGVTSKNCKVKDLNNDFIDRELEELDEEVQNDLRSFIQLPEHIPDREVRAENFVRSKDDKVPQSLSDAELIDNKSKRGMRSDDISECELDRVIIDLTFREEEEGLQCRGNVLVNKCEGLCSSSVTPSVIHYDGFERNCSCCRDVTRRSRAVTLSTCLIGSNEVVGYSITREIVEPISCACQSCRN